MNLYLRLLRILFASLWKAARSPRDEVASRFRVWPQDIDVFGHMNNGRYLQVMDVARVDWMRRTRILDRIFANRCSALLGGSVIRYCKALRPFETYSVHTSLIAWEARWAFLQHRCINEAGELVALGYTRAALRNAHGWVAPQRILEQVEPGIVSGELPSLVRRWLGVDDALVEGGSFAHLTDDASPQPVRAMTRPACHGPVGGHGERTRDSARGPMSTRELESEAAGADPIAGAPTGAGRGSIGRAMGSAAACQRRSI